MLINLIKIMKCNYNKMCAKELRLILMYSLETGTPLGLLAAIVIHKVSGTPLKL